MRLLAPLGPFAEMTDFLTFLYTSNSEIPNLSKTWSLKKELYGFRTESNRIGHHRECLQCFKDHFIFRTIYERI